jgi:hypothetical protein
MSVNLGVRDKNIVIVNLLSSWANCAGSGYYNNPWSTFTSSGRNITSAIRNAGVTYCNAISNNFSASNGSILYVDYNLTVVSGTFPNLYLMNGGVGLIEASMSSGANTLSFNIYSTDTYYLDFAANWSNTNLLEYSCIFTRVYTNV